MFYIWSYEHNAWWCAKWCGYTRQLSEAGQYDAEEAKEICEISNSHVPPDRPEEIAVPVSDARSWNPHAALAALSHRPPTRGKE